MDSQKPVPLTLIGLSIVIAIQIAGFALLWNEITSQQQYIYLPTENKQGASTGTQTNPVVAITKFPTESVLREPIQSVLKQELTPYVRQLAAAPEVTQKTSSTEPPGVKENSPANIQAFNESTNVVDGAIAQGKWTREDNIALMQYVPYLTHSQRITIMEKIGQAINGQELKMEAIPPPL
jgi:hypothetical protein